MNISTAIFFKEIFKGNFFALFKNMTAEFSICIKIWEESNTVVEYEFIGFYRGSLSYGTKVKPIGFCNG